MSSSAMVALSRLVSTISNRSSTCRVSSASAMVKAGLPAATRRSLTAVRCSKKLLDRVSTSVFRLECLDAQDIEAAIAVIDRFDDQGLGIADASLVVLADRYDTRDVLTLDERHFRVLRDGKGRPFRVLPADA